MPSKQDLTTIFKSLMSGHVLGFPQQVCDSVDKIVEASLVLYEEVSKKFLPSAVKFTYNWVRMLYYSYAGMFIKSKFFNTEFERVDKYLPRYLHDQTRRIQCIRRHCEGLDS